MRLSLFLLVALSVAPVLLLPIEDETSKTIVEHVSDATQLAGDDEDEDSEQTASQVAETSTTNNSTAEDYIPRQKWSRGKFSKQRKNRINRLDQKSKRVNGRRRRPNGKKGASKARTSRPIISTQFLDRSSRTDELNVVLDDMLAYFSEAWTKENLTFNVRLSSMPANMKLLPWGYVSQTPLKKNGTELEIKTRHAREAEDLEAEASETSLADLADEDLDEVVEDDRDQEDDHEEVSGLQEESENVQEETTSVQEEGGSVQKESNVLFGTNTTDSAISEQVEEKRDDEDDDDEDEEVSSNTTDPIISPKRFFLTENPVPILQADGMVEYSLQLLSEEDIKERKFEGVNEDDYVIARWEEARESRKVAGSKRQRGSSRRYSRRSSSRVEGIQMIRRSGDVMMGLKGNITRILEVPLHVGPVQLVMKDVAGFSLQNCRVSSDLLTARLRLTEVAGNIVSVRFKPKKIRLNDTLVTIRLKEDQELPKKYQTTRLVSHLSREFVRVWNSGYLLQKVKRRFKQVFIAQGSKKSRVINEDAKRFTDALALSINGDSQPTTAVPLITNN